MNRQEYMETLERKYARHFDIDRNIAIFGENLDIYAKHYNINVRTFITKNDIIDRYENNEYCFVKGFEKITGAETEAFEELLKTAAGNLVKPDREHMSTYITGVLVAESIEENAVKAIKAFRYSKAYKFYLHGWCDVRYIGVDLGKETIITNKAGKVVNKVYSITP
ncbi:MAG: hypothetical protein ACM3ZR_00115 [Pseudomonadota bacterium]